MAKRYWLFKSEPAVFSFEDLGKVANQTTVWEGVRNYQARNMLRDDVRVGDEVFFYHSRVDPMHVAGIARVVRAGYPDPHQFNPKSNYHDSGSSPEDPRWFAVDLQYQQALARPVTLEEMRKMAELEEMVLLRKGSRLSIQPVTAEQWKVIVAASRRAAPASSKTAGTNEKATPGRTRLPRKGP